MPAGGSPPSAKSEKFSSPELRSAAFALGRWWRQERRGLPLDVRESSLDLLLIIQPNIVPTTGACPVNIAEARVEVSGLLNLCQGIATRGSMLLPPPPPPPLPCGCTDYRENITPIILKLEEHIGFCRTDDVCFASILDYLELDSDFTEASETNCVDEPKLDAVPLELEITASETICVEEPTLDIVPSESQVIATAQPLPAYDDKAHWEDDWYEVTRNFFRGRPELSETQAEELCEQEWLSLHGFYRRVPGPGQAKQ